MPLGRATLIFPTQLRLWLSLLPPILSTISPSRSIKTYNWQAKTTARQLIFNIYNNLESLQMATVALILNALTVVLGSFQYGHHIGELNSPQKVITTCPEPVLPALEKGLGGEASSSSLPTCIPMTNAEWSVLVATLTLGGFIGSLFVGSRLANRLGRRGALLVNNVPLVLGSLAMGMASSYGTMIVGRFLIGLGCGTVTVIVPMYLAEISPAELRGSLGKS
jgi:MFS family permease